MSATRVNTVGSEFRTILTRIREVKETLEQTDNVEVARQLGEVNDSLRILEGNQSEFADAVFKVLENIESKMTEGFKFMEAKIAELDAKMRPSCEVSPCTPSPTSSGKKRKIARHPDLSHYVRSKIEQLGLLWNTEKKENEDPNQQIANTLLKEIQEVEQIKNDALCTERRVLDAISQNFASCKKKRRQEQSGTYERYQQDQKRRQRMKRKLDKRLKVVREQEKSNQMYEALHISLISSDESDAEDDALATRPLTWRMEDVTKYFQLLDERWKTGMTPQQKRQSVSRRLGLPSERTTTGVPQHLLWAVRAD